MFKTIQTPSPLHLLGLSFLIVINALLLWFSLSHLSIGASEANIYFNSSSFVGVLARLINSDILGADAALRAPFLAIHILNIILIYAVSLGVVKRPNDALISAGIYAFLPGVMASAILVSGAGVAINIALWLILSEQKNWRALFAVIASLSLMIGGEFWPVYVAILAFGLIHKNRFFIVLGAVLLIVWFGIGQIDISGKPRGYFIDTIGLFAAVFSPLLFVYFIYAVYRVAIKEIKSFSWVLVATALGLCAAISLRQKPDIVQYLPFCVIFVPHMVRIFFSSFRARLAQFRKSYFVCAVLVMALFISSSLASLFHPFLYGFIKRPSAHFAYQYTGFKELASELKNRGIKEVKASNKLARQLRFYGIKSGDQISVATINKEGCERINIKKHGHFIRSFFICKEPI